MLDGIETGEVEARPRRRTIRENSATVILDGNFGLGITSCRLAMDHAIKLAGAHGVGLAIVVNSNHFLAAAPYCIQAAEEGLIGLMFANGASGMAYPGTYVGALGNSPVGFAVPTGAGFPIVFDAALTLSGGKLTQWSKEGTSIPNGFMGFDAEGNLSSDPSAIFDGGVPLPIGLHKGAGLGVLVDILTGVLGGTTFLRTLVPDEHPEWRRTTSTHTCIAIDVESLIPLFNFRERTAAYIADLKAKPLAPGHAEILLPGERAARAVEDAMRHGVPLEDDVIDRLSGIASRFGIATPPVISD
jgi:LDH2 family malate/lactate/ureidoglycolate dehydrogenase